MRKFKNMQKYYKDLKNGAKKERVSIKPSDWYDNWHTHIDWDGKGNLGTWHRREHLKALMILYWRIKKQLANAPFSSQVFMIISKTDSAADSVYIHTQNPNGTDYPDKFKNVNWLKKKPYLLKCISIPSGLRIGVTEHNGETWFYLA